MVFTTLRRPGRCAVCGSDLPAGVRADFDPQRRVVSCAHHHTGPAGPLSVRVFADDLARRRREDLRRRFGPLAGLVDALRVDPQVAAAQRGAAGEERLAARLDRAAGRSNGTIVALHDRAIPGRRENLDHLVVSPGAVWVVDAKAHRGQVRATGRALQVRGRDASALLAQSRRQHDFVTAAVRHLGLGPVPVHAALCFVDARLAWWPGGRVVGGSVRVLTPGQLSRHLRATGQWDADRVVHVAAALAGWFTPASRAPRG